MVKLRRVGSTAARYLFDERNVPEDQRTVINVKVLNDGEFRRVKEICGKLDREAISDMEGCRLVFSIAIESIERAYYADGEPWTIETGSDGRWTSGCTEVFRPYFAEILDMIRNAGKVTDDDEKNF